MEDWLFQPENRFSSLFCTNRTPAHCEGSCGVISFPAGGATAVPPTSSNTPKGVKGLRFRTAERDRRIHSKGGEERWRACMLVFFSRCCNTAQRNMEVMMILMNIPAHAKAHSSHFVVQILMWNILFLQVNPLQLQEVTCLLYRYAFSQRSSTNFPEIPFFFQVSLVLLEV